MFGRKASATTAANTDPFLGFDFGDTAEDMITGVHGAVTGKLQFATGCAQVLLQGKVGEDQKLAEPNWFDVTRLTKTGRADWADDLNAAYAAEPERKLAGGSTPAGIPAY